MEAIGWTTAAKIAGNSPTYVITILFVMLLWASHNWKDKQLDREREDKEKMEERFEAHRKEWKEERRELIGKLDRMADVVESTVSRMERLEKQRDRTDAKMDRVLLREDKTA